MKLSNVVTLRRPKRISSYTHKATSDDVIVCDKYFSVKSLTSGKFEKINIKQSEANKLMRVTKNTLIITSMFPSNKVVYQCQSSQDILVSSNLLILDVDENMYDPQMLALLFSSKFIDLERFTQGAVIKQLRFSEIENIDLPKIDENLKKQIKTLIAYKQMQEKQIKLTEKLINGLVRQELKKG